MKKDLVATAPATGVEPPSRQATVLDACCGSRMCWFDKDDPRAMFIDNREESHILCDGRTLEIKPTLKADFTNLPFDNESFWLILFDPPHMTSLGHNSWMAKKYGRFAP